MFEQVPRLPAHHLHGATLQDGPRLWAVAAFGGEVSLCSTVGGVHVAHPESLVTGALAALDEANIKIKVPLTWSIILGK